MCMSTYVFVPVSNIYAVVFILHTQAGFHVYIYVHMCVACWYIHRYRKNSIHNMYNIRNTCNLHNKPNVQNIMSITCRSTQHTLTVIGIPGIAYTHIHKLESRADES